MQFRQRVWPYNSQYGENVVMSVRFCLSPCVWPVRLASTDNLPFNTLFTDTQFTTKTKHMDIVLDPPSSPSLSTTDLLTIRRQTVHLLQSGGCARVSQALDCGEKEVVLKPPY